MPNDCQVSPQAKNHGVLGSPSLWRDRNNSAATLWGTIQWRCQPHLFVERLHDLRWSAYQGFCHLLYSDQSEGQWAEDWLLVLVLPLTCGINKQ